MAASKPVRPIKILLVEGNPGAVDLVAEMHAELASAEYHIKKTEKLADALGQLQTDFYDIVLLDLNLPDSRGLETLQSLKGRPP